MFSSEDKHIKLLCLDEPNSGVFLHEPLFNAKPFQHASLVRVKCTFQRFVHRQSLTTDAGVIDRFPARVQNVLQVRKVDVRRILKENVNGCNDLAIFTSM